MTKPNIHDVNEMSDVVELGAAAARFVVEATVDTVRFLIHRDSQVSPGEKGDKKIATALAAAGVLATARSFGIR